MQEPQPMLTQVHGRVLRVVPEERLPDGTLAPAARIAGYSLPALLAIKEPLNRSCASSLTEGILHERRALRARFASDDACEGTHAFLSRRTPVFQHR